LLQWLSDADSSIRYITPHRVGGWHLISRFSTIHFDIALRLPPWGGVSDR